MKMKGLFQFGTIKLSPVFVILIIVSFAVFTLAMVNLLRLPTPEEKRAESMRQMDELMLAEQAQAMGGTVEELKRRGQDNKRKNKSMQNLVQAIKQKDDAAVVKLLHELKNDYKKLSNLFVTAAKENNEFAFHSLLETGIPCSYSSHHGAQAFMAAISSENPAFLKLLLEKKCDYTEHSQSDSLGRRIVQSRYPEKIFQLSETFIDSKFRDEALVIAINKRMSKQVLTMLDLGANPNAVTKQRNRSALYLSLINNMPQVTLRLIQKGAMIEAEHLVGKYEVLSWAIIHGHLDIAQEVIERKPDYIRRKDLGKSILNSAFYLKDSEVQKKALKLIHDNIKQSEFDDLFLHEILRYKKSAIALSMLDLGVNPDAFSNSKKASALFLSLQNNKPIIAMRLIRQGAKIGVEDVSNGQYDVLSTAIKKGYLDAADEMLKRNPDYLRRENIAQTALTAALYVLKEPAIQQEAITLLLQNGVDPSKLKNGGIQWLIKTVELQDPILLKKLLNSGIDPNRRSQMRLALGVAKSINKNKATGVNKPKTSANKDTIIAILKQHGATDDLLAIVRKENGIDLDANCKIGREVNIDTVAMIEKYAQGSQKKKNSMSKNDWRRCTAVTANCANQGHGADDCMRSVQACDPSKVDQSPLCCTNELKQRYFEARCSKLDVSESRRWMTIGGQ